jgi:hypothetical protein
MTTTPDESWIDPIFNGVVSDIMASGYFQRVNMHDVDRSPGNGLTAAVWLQHMQPVPLASGLDSTSALVVFMVRIFANLNTDVQDMLDPSLMRAASNLMRRYHDDFDFGGAIRNVDLMGEFGSPLASQAGYIEFPEGGKYRVIDVTVPCIVNDVWPQVK